MTGRQPNNGGDPGRVEALKGLLHRDLLLHVESILEEKGGDAVTPSEQTARFRRRKSRTPAPRSPSPAPEQHHRSPSPG